jgi:hypothetical protein
MRFGCLVGGAPVGRCGDERDRGDYPLRGEAVYAGEAGAGYGQGWKHTPTTAIRVPARLVALAREWDDAGE